MAISLFDPIKLGAIEAPNRIVMAPLTRGRAGPGFVPNELAREYYRQRASAGLIISEATGISQEGLGWPNAPGLWTDAQVEGWKPVTDVVHEAGGRIIAQLWHMGRLVHSVFNDGKQPVSASATTGTGRAHTPVGRMDLEEARPLRLDEIPRLIGDYVKAAENAKRAGFDGVQLHGANGYLIDQFLRDGSNLRDDDYGGSIENRIRLLREVTQALIGVWGKDRVAVRLSPNGETQGVDDSAPEKLFPDPHTPAGCSPPSPHAPVPPAPPPDRPDIAPWPPRPDKTPDSAAESSCVVKSAHHPRHCSTRISLSSSLTNACLAFSGSS